MNDIKSVENKWKTKVFLGTRKEDNARIYIDAPSWNCGWYWGFGYLGNKNEHYHLSSYQNKSRRFNSTEEGCNFEVITERRNKNIHDCLLEDYDLNPKIKDNLWTFCELVLTAYTLKQTAEVLGRGASRMTINPCKEVIINKDEVDRINKTVLPSIFNEIIKLIE